MKLRLIIGFISLILLVIIQINNDYLKLKDRKCLVINKFTSPGKTSSSYYLILKELSTERKFNLFVSPLGYDNAKINQVFIYKLREMDIEQTNFKNLFFFILPGSLFFLGTSLITVSLIYWCLIKTKLLNEEWK